MNNLEEAQDLPQETQKLQKSGDVQLTEAQKFQADRLNYIYWWYYMMSKERQSRGFTPIRRQQFDEEEGEVIKKQEMQQSEQNLSENQQSKYVANSDLTSKKTRNNNCKKGIKIKKRKKENDRNTEKNLLVHLKLWLQRFIQQKGRTQPFVRKQFQRIFTNGLHKSSKQVYMNLSLLEKVLQNETLRPCLKQFFESRILRYLMNSNIQNKICIMKYVPILLKKYTQGKCQSLKS